MSNVKVEPQLVTFDERTVLWAHMLRCEDVLKAVIQQVRISRHFGELDLMEKLLVFVATQHYKDHRKVITKEELETELNVRLTRSPQFLSPTERELLFNLINEAFAADVRTLAPEVVLGELLPRYIESRNARAGIVKAPDMTDSGNAMVFVKEFSESLRWCEELGLWLEWAGYYWRTVKNAHIVATYVEKLNYEILPLIANEESEKVSKLWDAWVSKSRMNERINALLAQVKARLSIDVGELNINPHLFACANKVLDLRTGQPVEARREDYITIASPVTYEPAATCPTFEKFIHETLVNADGTPVPEMVAYVKRALGYCLTPSTEEQLFFIAHGIGRNGKSTLMNVISEVLGEYAVSGCESLLTESHKGSGATPDEARLMGRRLCVTNEVQSNSALADAKVKRLTGSDRISARFLHQNLFEFAPTHKLFLLANFKPRINVEDMAILRRIKLIPFNHVVPVDQVDGKLTEKLKAELPGILNWMLAGLAQWQAGQGLGDAYTPDIMKAAKDGYIEENDTLGEFIAECTFVVDGGSVTKDGLYRRYREWCESAGRQGVMCKNKLSTKLMARGWKGDKEGKDRNHVWLGYTTTPAKDYPTAPRLPR